MVDVPKQGFQPPLEACDNAIVAFLSRWLHSSL